MEPAGHKTHTQQDKYKEKINTKKMDYFDGLIYFAIAL